MNPIQPIKIGSLPQAMPGFSSPMTASSPVSFQDMLTGAISEANSGQQAAQLAIQDGLAGNDITNAEVFTAVKKADMSLRTMVQIRNKLVDAFNEVQNLRM